MKKCIILFLQKRPKVTLIWKPPDHAAGGELHTSKGVGQQSARAEWQHMDVADAGALGDAHLHAEVPYHLMGPDADGMLVLAQMPLQQLFVSQLKSHLAPCLHAG